ncbi:MAG: coproporphyrinogen dehydrogenase HemZ [Eubacterium sp.]|jgi:oxygen-independent coproporphyrinogen-3 oxidase
MIQFEIKKNHKGNGEFSYDLQALAASFYPEKQCVVNLREDWQEKSGYPFLMTVDGKVLCDECLPEGYTKNQVKQVCYRALEKLSGRKLPWGILTGIRPAKIALRMLWQGMDESQVQKQLCEEYLVHEKKATLAWKVANKENELIGGADYAENYNLYIGIPFCPSICQYCSFSSYDYKRFADRADAYLDALEKEIAYTAQAFSGKKLHTIYVGGGTPTSLSEPQLKRLMDLIHRYLPVEEAKEFTVEAGRPDSITKEKLRILRAAEVTRISINPQTMKQETLDRIGRKHTVKQIKDVFYEARKQGFDNINMDLIVGLPGEDEVDFVNTLLQIGKMEPDSVTVHTLVIKRASRMRREQLESGADMRAEDLLIPYMQDSSGEYFEEQGFEPYYMYRQKNKSGTTRNTNQENVAYAKPGKECLYNMLIMEELETIVALGSGASTKIVYPGENRMERVENVKNVDEYINRIDEMIERKRSGFRELLQK